MNFEWDDDKNQRLFVERSLSFEMVVLALEDGRLLDDMTHPNAEHYAHQRLMVVEIDGYACGVPYIENDDHLFLKTIYHSRAFQKKYLTG
ncbi:MAG: hypothetical protein L3J05_00325 [Robiginitomaculum sp.]|nr:hypothetical protein [Robiginitomaculum sp.]